MCSDPQTFNDFQVACRSCDDCLKTRKNTWVARAMAEKATAGQALVVRLSYRNNEDGTLPAGAIFFEYADVSAFMKRLREAYFAYYKERGEIRFICPGEMGSAKGRVHYHLILFSKKPLDCLGILEEFTTGSPITLERAIEKGCNVNWSIWKKGHVHFSRPDRAGMAYALKYALKDQFGAVKSAKTMRATKSETHSAGLFRMSKHPPIGYEFLQQEIQKWRDGLYVPIRLEIKVPEYSGYWFPQGTMRMEMLQAIHEINQKHNEQHGSDCAQWSSLLSSLSVNNITDQEALIYGQVSEEEQVEDAKREFLVQGDYQSYRDGAAAAQRIRFRCGGILPCRYCRLKGTDDEWDALKEKQRSYYQQWVDEGRSPSGKVENYETEFAEYWATHARPSQGCRDRHLAETRWAFEVGKAVEDYRRKHNGRTKEKADVQKTSRF